MALYHMPPDTSAREKIVGGILDWVQLIWVLVGVGIGLLIGNFFRMLGGGMVGMVIGLIPGIAFAIVFCFVKIHELSVFDYIKYKRKHKAKTKKLPNIRLDALDSSDISKIRNY